MVEADARSGALVAMSGFQPLTADVLAIAMARHGLRATPLDPHPRAGSADVVVAAIDHNTITRLDELRLSLPGVPIVAVAPTVSGPLRHAARRVGVAALLPRSSGLDPLLQVLVLVLAGGNLESIEDHSDSRLGDLTERELEVLRLLAAGSTNTEIGAVLGISSHTARTHVQNLMAKLGVRTRLAAGAVARQAGLTSGGLG